MTNRELLELTAKAAGIPLAFAEGIDDLLVRRTDTWDNWNPLDDDGDALRLSAKLRMEIDHNHSADSTRWVSVRVPGQLSCSVEEFEDEGQRLTATRLAITRAAAAIGEKMP